MACCQPLSFFPKREHRYNFETRFPHGLFIPCGYCLNCRVDKRNQWSDRAKWEFSQKLTASFVTVTYSDPWLLSECTHIDPISDKPVANLEYKHIQDFIARLRKYVKYHPEIQGVLANPDFSYIYVGEYGEKGAVFDRPHFHILFFGLDFAFMKKIFAKEWKYGFIDVLPLLNGGIEYVLKYMDKQLFGALAKEKYDNHLLNRPAMRSSISFGSTLYLSKKDEIIKNNMKYKSGRALRPVPAYYKKKLLGSDASETNDPVLLREKIDRWNYQSDVMSRVYRLKDLSYKARELFSFRKAQLRESNLYNRLIASGNPAFNFVIEDCGNHMRYNRSVILRLSPDVARRISDEYRNSLEVG